MKTQIRTGFSVLGCMKFEFNSNEAFFKGEIQCNSDIMKINDDIKNLIVQNYYANLNQNYRNALLRDRNANCNE